MQTEFTKLHKLQRISEKTQQLKKGKRISLDVVGIFRKRTMTIEKSEEKPFEGTQQKNEPLSDELTHYKEEGQRMIDGYRSFFAIFASDISLSFQMSNGFYIDLEKGVIHLDTKWFADKDFSETQIVWANLHELSHFRDLAEDSENMMGNFEYMRRCARKTGDFMMRKWEEKYGATDPEFIEQLKKQKPTSKKENQIQKDCCRFPQEIRE